MGARDSKEKSVNGEDVVVDRGERIQDAKKFVKDFGLLIIFSIPVAICLTGIFNYGYLNPSTPELVGSVVGLSFIFLIAVFYMVKRMPVMAKRVFGVIKSILLLGVLGAIGTGIYFALKKDSSGTATTTTKPTTKPATKPATTKPATKPATTATTKPAESLFNNLTVFVYLVCLFVLILIDKAIR